MTGGVDPRAIEATYALIRPYIRRTPVVEAAGGDLGAAGAGLLLKLEQLQHERSRQ